MAMPGTSMESILNSPERKAAEQAALQNYQQLMAQRSQTPMAPRQIYNPQGSLIPPDLQRAYGPPNSYQNYMNPLQTMQPPMTQAQPQAATQAMAQPTGSAGTYNALANMLSQGQTQAAPFKLPMSMVSPWLQGLRG